MTPRLGKRRVFLVGAVTAVMTTLLISALYQDLSARTILVALVGAVCAFAFVVTSPKTWREHLEMVLPIWFGLFGMALLTATLLRGYRFGNGWIPVIWGIGPATLIPSLALMCSLAIGHAFLKHFTPLRLRKRGPILVATFVTFAAGMNVYFASQPGTLKTLRPEINTTEILVFTSGLSGVPQATITVDVKYGWLPSTTKSVSLWTFPTDTTAAGVEVTIKGGSDAGHAWIAVPKQSRYDLQMVDGAELLGELDPTKMGDCGSELDPAQHLPRFSMLLYRVEFTTRSAVVHFSGNGSWQLTTPAVQSDWSVLQPPGVAFFGGDAACSALPIPGFQGYDFSAPQRRLKVGFIGLLPTDTLVDDVVPNLSADRDIVGRMVWDKERTEDYWAFQLSPSYRVSTGASRGVISAGAIFASVLIGFAAGGLVLVLEDFGRMDKAKRIRGARPARRHAPSLRRVSRSTQRKRRRAVSPTRDPDAAI